EPEGPGVARVLRQRIGGHREVGEDGEQPLGDRLAALVSEDLSGPEVVEEVAVLLADDRHGVLASGRRRAPPTSLALARGGNAAEGRGGGAHDGEERPALPLGPLLVAADQLLETRIAGDRQHLVAPITARRGAGP